MKRILIIILVLSLALSACAPANKVDHVHEYKMQVGESISVIYGSLWVIFQNTQNENHTDSDILDWVDLINMEADVLMGIEVPPEMEEFHRGVMRNLIPAFEATSDILAYGRTRLEGKAAESRAYRGSFLFKLAEVRKTWGLTDNEGQMYDLIQYYRENSE